MRSAGLPLWLVASSLLVVLFRDLKVVLHGDLRGVPQPRADDVDRELLQEFRLAAGSQILKELWPRFDLGLLEDPQELGPEVHPAAA
jgi:hypothetical protein